ncbi:exonuclease domain-containing protein [Rheinheimera sp.]|uniref:exonuclease domain-containing protein n=1 Tax=Rheinheimera sp. TaxID=1869214 RepID=UPI002734123F|nr:exonuclease domain-containing protein [Rheinheimera sp.]MDP2714528.1 exonuclease domain-containing protein [Rheinheimera sp.]
MPQPRPELDSSYYLQHFNELLQFVTQHYQGVLSADSSGFIEYFYQLSHSAQQLLVRMLNRKGSVFADIELSYAEIGATAPLLDELTQAGFIAPLTEADLADFWLRLTKDTLWQLLQLAQAELAQPTGAKKSQTKPQLLGAALKLPVNWLVLISKLPQRYVALRRQDALNYIYFLYFGRIEANLSLFTLRDLGIRQTGQFKQQFSPRFTEAAQAQLAYQLAKAKPAIIELGKQLKKQSDKAETLLSQWLQTVIAWPQTEDNALLLKRSERCYQLGKLAEQYQLNELAICFYQHSNGFPASERLARLYAQTGDEQRCRQYLQQLLDDPSCDEEWLFAEDFYRRKFSPGPGAKAANKRRSQLTQLLHDAPLVGVDELYLGKAEQGLMAHYAAQGYTVFHTENNLWLALFGLWFWHELFEHQHSSLHNPFERRPRNLAAGGFYQQFESEIEHKLSQLAAPAAASTLLSALTAHYGKANSLFYWHSDLAEQLLPLLSFAPKKTDGSSALAAILRAMAQDFPRHSSGYPDLLLIKENQLEFIEVKAPGDKIQRHQLARLLALNNAGFNARIEKLQWIADPNRLYVVLDVETTGGKAGTDRVIEIGAVKVQAGEVLDTFSTLLNPGRYIPSFITRLTGINSSMVADAPGFADIAGQLAEFLQGAVFVAHNAKFDYGFIRAEFARLEQPFDMPQLCTVVNMRRYYPGLASYSLGNLCTEFEIKLTNHHRALDDATATVELLKLINAKRQLL